MELNRPRRSPQAGFSVLETLLAMSLLAVVLVAISRLFSLSIVSNAMGFHYTSINSLARDKFEQLRSLPATDPTLRVPLGSAFYSAPNDLPAYLPDPKTGKPGTLKNPYSRTYTVEALRYTYDPASGSSTVQVVNGGDQYDVKRITVTVVSMGGWLVAVQTLTNTTYVRNPDLAGNVL